MTTTSSICISYQIHTKSSYVAGRRHECFAQIDEMFLSLLFVFAHAHTCEFVCKHMYQSLRQVVVLLSQHEGKKTRLDSTHATDKGVTFR